MFLLCTSVCKPEFLFADLFADGSRSQTPSFHEMHTSEADLSASWSADMMVDDDFGEDEFLGDSMVRGCSIMFSSFAFGDAV